MTSVVPSSCWLIVSDRSTSSVTSPPALRSTCASPGASPSSAYTSILASMQATTATDRVGRPGGSAEYFRAYCLLLASSSSVADMRRLSGICRDLVIL